MYPLDEVYGHRAYRTFIDEGTLENKLKKSRQTPLDIFNDSPLTASSYTELVAIASFLSVMNKRHTLYFRGQGKHLDPIPAIFRSSWRSPSDKRYEIADPIRRQKIYDGLNNRIKAIVLSVCSQFPMPRKNTLTMFRESVWAIAQHYEIWPTPLIDITPNLRAAASFALWKERPEANLYVVALPPSTNSITFEADQHIVLARLHAVCPPDAKRPHYQDGFLVGRFPFQGPNKNEIDSKPGEFSSLSRRLVARILLKNPKTPKRPGGSFWSDDFPEMSEAALTPGPKDDKLLDKFMPHAAEINEMMSDICRN
jgi:hypothetical protein